MSIASMLHRESQELAAESWGVVMEKKNVQIGITLLVAMLAKCDGPKGCAKLLRSLLDDDAMAERTAALMLHCVGIVSAEMGVRLAERELFKTTDNTEGESHED